MTLKKLLKRVYSDEMIVLESDGTRLYRGFVKNFKDLKHYDPCYGSTDFDVERISPVADTLYISIKPHKKKSYDLYRNKESGHIFVEDKHDKAKQLESILDSDTMESDFKKEYREFMKKYVKEHLDEIGLKDGGYAGDSAEDYGCCDCKYTDLDSGSFPCNECSHAYIDKWESKE